MIVVIQCASGKNPTAGCLVTKGGKLVKFVANPELAPRDGYLYQHPDDLCEGISWRKVLCDYNNNPLNNPNGLLPAWELYTPKTDREIYRQLVNRFGIKNTFILSAGWGLISADFLTPSYDITFSKNKNVEQYKRRNLVDIEIYDDLCLLPKDGTDKLVFLGGQSYIPLFCKLTNGYKGPRTILYKSADPPKADCGNLMRFETTRNTNWHYECAGSLIRGEIDV